MTVPLSIRFEGAALLRHREGHPRPLTRLLVRSAFVAAGQVGELLGRDGKPEKVLYEVRFQQTELWHDYNGPESETLLMDIYEHWLSRVRP